MTQERIIATDENIREVVYWEIVRLGNQADLNHIDVSRVTDMECVFYQSRFNGDISQWDTSKVEDMESMFHDSQFNGDISQWDVSKVETMAYMFHNSKFNGDISQWAVRDDLAADSVFEKSPVSAHPDFGKLHFMTKADDESLVLHPDAEAAYATSMPIAKAMYPNESPSVQGAMAWEAYQASLSQVSKDSYDYTAALDACDFSSSAESEYTR